ncbi:MAG: DUF6687 family protein [Acidimicrobiales bacterium]
MVGLRRLRRNSRSPFRYLPIGGLSGRPHVMVDGAARPGTICNLSHWPRTSLPDVLRMDLSAQIVARALESGYLSDQRADVATIDHYDADGVIGLALVVSPDLLDSHGEVLIEAARVGDFGVVTDDRAARVSYALSALADPQRSPVEAIRKGSASGGLEVCGLATERALELIPDLVEESDRYQELWRDEYTAFEASRQGLGSWATIEELPEHDVAIVRIDPDEAASSGSAWGDHVIHPAAVYTSTSMLRVVTLAGGRIAVRFRYESWVRLITSRPRPRVDLSGLAKELDQLEPSGARWIFDGASATRPALRTSDSQPSGIAHEMFVERLTSHLAQLDAGPPAWDPYT